MLLAGLMVPGAATLPMATAQTVSPVAATLPPRAIRPEDIMGLTDVSDVDISPDGRHLVYVTQPTLATSGASRSAIWLASSDRSALPKRLTTSIGIDGSPQWSPEGDRIAFLSNRPDPSARGVSGFDLQPAREPVEAGGVRTGGAPGSGPSRQLWVISPAGGEARPLTALARDIRSFRWSPDGRRIAILAPDGPSDSARGDRAARRDWIELDSARDPTRLWILDLETRSLKRIAIDRSDISEVSWSPDGRRLSARVSAATGLNDYFYHSDLVIIDPATGEVGPRIFKGVYGAGSWAPDGIRLAFTGPETNTIGIRAFVANLSSGTVQQLDPEIRATLRQLEWTTDGRLLARAAVRTRDTLLQLDPTSNRFRPLLAFNGRIRSISIARDGSIALSGSQSDRPADVWSYRRKKLQLVTDLNPQTRQWQLGQVREIDWPSSRDGRQIYGILVTPTASRAAGSTKTVVLAHGGPHENWSAAWQGSWIDWAQLLASNGYVVLLPNPRGSSGQGSDFAHQLVGNWGRGDLQDIVDGLDKLVAEGITDPERIGIGGWSYGGFMSAFAITHDDRFKTAIVGAGVTDLSGISLATDTPDWFAGYFGHSSESIAAADAFSPVRATDRAKGPVLVLHGQDDVRVPLTQGLAFYRGLRIAGKEAEMVVYPREPHRIGEVEHQLDIQRRVLAWYDRHL